MKESAIFVNTAQLNAGELISRVELDHSAGRQVRFYSGVGWSTDEFIMASLAYFLLAIETITCTHLRVYTRSAKLVGEWNARLRQQEIENDNSSLWECIAGKLTGLGRPAIFSETNAVCNDLQKQLLRDARYAELDYFVI